MKKIIVSLLILPLLFSLGSFLVSQKAHAQISGCNNIVITKESTGFVANLGDAKIYKLTITNRNAATCTYTFKGSGFNGEIWNFTFYKFYSNGSLSQAITSSNALSVGASGKTSTFFALVNPGTETKKNPGDKLVKIQSNTSGATEYEILTFTVSGDMACKARAYECGRFQYDGKPYSCNNSCTGSQTCSDNHKCVSPAQTCADAGGQCWSNSIPKSECTGDGGTILNSKTCTQSNHYCCKVGKPSTPITTRDLIVSAFTFPGGVDTGTSDPTIKIKNQGNTQITGDFKVKVVNKDGGTAKTWTVSQVVSPGEVIDLSSKFVNMPRPAAGTHLANAFVDSAGNISETNEGNNFKTDSYTTTKPDSNPTTKPPTNPPAPTCDKNPPTLEITPNNRNGNPGDEKEYSIKITNNDQGAACDPVNFVLSKEHLPNDSWTGSFTDNTLSNIDKNGGSKSTTFKLKSPSGATEGQKTITLGLKREGQTAAQVQVNTFYTVTPNNPPTEQPATCTRNAPEFIVTPDSLESTPGEEADYKIEITNKDTGTCSPKTLSLTAVFPNNSWQAFFGKDSPFDLAQDAKQITNVRIKSPDTATPGDKKITLNIINSNGTILASKDIAYVIPGVTPTQCVQNNPEFSITPQTKNGNPGEGVTYEMTIKNVDQSDCNSRTFSFQANPPNNDWTTNFSENSSSFAPGESKNINVTITSPSNISTGEHTTVLKLLENNSQLSSIVAVYNVEDQITPIPGNTYLNFKLGIDGIGTTPRIPIGGNKNPNNIWRRLNFRIYNTVTNTLSFTGTNITFTYNQDSEKFELLYDLPSVENLPNGSYNIYVEGPGFLTNQYPGSFSINHGQVTNLISNNFYLITGNVNNNDLSENKIDLMDYNLLLSCSTYSQDRTACDQGENNQEYTDLNDDGIVNEDDYTLFLKEFASQQGVILPD